MNRFRTTAILIYCLNRFCVVVRVEVSAFVLPLVPRCNIGYIAQGGIADEKSYNGKRMMSGMFWQEIVYAYIVINMFFFSVMGL